LTFNKSTDLNFLRVNSVERGQGRPVAGGGGTHGQPVVLVASTGIQTNYLNIQLFNALNTAEDFINFRVDGVIVITDILVDQGGGGVENVTNINFKTEIPKGSEVSVTVRSTTDFSGVDVIVFLSGI